MKNLFTVIDNKLEKLISKYFKSKIEKKLDTGKELFYINRMLKSKDYNKK